MLGIVNKKQVRGSHTSASSQYYSKVFGSDPEPKTPYGLVLKLSTSKVVISFQKHSRVGLLAV